MKTSYRIDNNHAYFMVSELSPLYQNAAENLEFTRGEKDTYYQSFPANTPNLERIFQQFEHSIEEMFLQTVNVHPVPWEQALLTFLEKVAPYPDISWWLVGSAALAVRGIDITPHDIDLSMDDAGAYTLEKILFDSLVQPVQETSDWISNTFGRAFLHARLEWVGGVDERADTPEVSDFGPIAKSRQEMVVWHGYELYVPPLELQLVVNEQRGRVERAQKIRQFLAR